MADYLRLFELVVRFVEAAGMAVRFERGAADVEGKLAAARRQLQPIALPPALAELYRQVGDGVSLDWDAAPRLPPTEEQVRRARRLSNTLGTTIEPGGTRGTGPLGMVEIPPLSKLVANHLGRRRWAVEHDEAATFPHVGDVELARATTRRMRHWLRFHAEGNGDEFCIDTIDAAGAVLFDRHDWFDGGSGANGSPMAASFEEFMDRWAGVCFQRPASLYWPAVLGDGGVAWGSAEFDVQFRLAGE